MTKAALLVVVALLWGGAAHADTALRGQVLDTPRYTVRIQVLCPEGEVTCDRVRYRGQARQSGRSLVLKGRTTHTLCADGVSPCRFLGWEFRNGRTTYFVSEAGELLVRQGERVLVQEQGTWR